MRKVAIAEMHAFAAIAERASFAKAAAHLGVSRSSLSETMRTLEGKLGVRLLNRTTRSVALTEAGEMLLARVVPAMAEVTEALAQVRGLREVPSGRLRINAPPPAVDLVLAPMVGPFLQMHPQIDLEIVAESGFVDIVSAGFDAGVR